MTVTVKEFLIRWYDNVILYGHALCIDNEKENWTILTNKEIYVSVKNLL